MFYASAYALQALKRVDEQVSQPRLGKAVLMETKPQAYLSALPKFNHQISKFMPLEYLAKLENMESSSNSEDEDGTGSTETLDTLQAPLKAYQDLHTGLCYDPRMRFHVEITNSVVDFHPEDPRRIMAIYKLLCEHGLVENPQYAALTRLVGRPLKRIPARYATKEECCRVHTVEHFEDLHETAGATDEALVLKGTKNDSVYFNQSTYSSALLAAGSAIDTVLAVLKGEVRNAVAVIRPPGHHAEAGCSSGFCHFDNVAVAVRNAQYQFPETKKVLIVDWDVHHGNGIQHAFEEDPNVLYISLHVHKGGKFYPGGEGGAIYTDGKGLGKGKNINIGWSDMGRNDGDYIMAFQHVIMPVAQEFDPDLVVVASGFDAADGDYLGGCFVTPACYAHMTHMLMALADGKVVVCLEGGYNLTAIANSALAVTKTLMGQAPPRMAKAEATAVGSQTIFEVINHHSQYWRSLVPKPPDHQFSAIADVTRIHDIVRSYSAEQYFRDYRMHPLPIHRDRPKELHSKTFEKQVLATRGFRADNELLIIFHDALEMQGAIDNVTGATSSSTSKIYDLAQPFVDWGVQKGFGVIDVNLPDFYTGISIEGDMEVQEHNRIIARVQLCMVADYIWQNYVSQFEGTNIVMLGLGNAFYAAQRIYSTHSKGDMDKYNVRAVGVIHDDVPGTPPSESMEHFEHYYQKWTTIWVPGNNKIFVDAKNGRPRKRYGGVRASEARGLSNMARTHERDIKNKILEHFNRSPEPSSMELEDRSVVSNELRSSILGKRPRAISDMEVNPAQPIGNEESEQLQ